MQKPSLLFLVNNDKTFYSHRINLAKAAKVQGFDVMVAAPISDYEELIKAQGIKVIPLKHFSRGAINPFKELFALIEVYKIYKKNKPSIVHHVALKAVIFGSLLAYFCKIPKIINALTGLGYVFTEPSKAQQTFKKNCKQLLLKCLLSPLIKFCLNQPKSILVLQNEDDLETLHQTNIKAQNLTIIPGSGVDIKAYPFCSLPLFPPIIVVLAARMLWDKGVGEFVEAAKIIKKTHSNLLFMLYGDIDKDNPAAISEAQLRTWQEDGAIEWKGYTADLKTVYENCHIVVLPSYREGLPKSLLEAASMGRPIITTKAPGCREIVQDQFNGLLVPPKDSTALSKAIISLVENPELRTTMGKNGRTLVETRFQDSIIIDKFLQLYQKP